MLYETFSLSPDLLVAQGGGVGHEAMSFLHEMKKVAGCGVMIGDESSGRVRYVEGGAPSLRYDLLDHDRRRMLRGLKRVGEMFFAAGARGVKPSVANGTYFTSRRAHDFCVESTRDAMDMMMYASHPMGTCRMGEDPRQAAVRPSDGQLHHVERLYVMDSSLMPSSLGVNPQMTIMAHSLALSRALAHQG